MDILILVAAVLLIGLFCYKNVPTLIGGIVLRHSHDHLQDGHHHRPVRHLYGRPRRLHEVLDDPVLPRRSVGKLLDITGGSDSLARVILNLVGPKNVSLGVCIFTAILAMAGISSFISLFICYPIALKLCRKANITALPLLPVTPSA
ncbi:MAG: hypothetical protein V8S72_04455 [Oscillospiraceae bacterium]